MPRVLGVYGRVGVLIVQHRVLHMVWCCEYAAGKGPYTRPHTGRRGFYLVRWFEHCDEEVSVSTAAWLI